MKATRITEIAHTDQDVRPSASLDETTGTGPADGTVTRQELLELQAAHLQIIENLRATQAALANQNRQLRDAQTALEETSARYRHLFEFAPVGYVSLDAGGKVVDVNVEASRMLGRRPIELGRFSAYYWVRPAFRPVLREHLAKIFTGEAEALEIELLDPNGQVIPVTWQSRPAFDAVGQTMLCKSALIDLSEQKRTQRRLERTRDQLKRLAHHDALTRLPNRLLFHDRLDQALERAKRAKCKVAVLFIDIDGFKEINDSHGHATGDLLLQSIAHRLQDSVRSVDTIGRMGGDEFTVILEGMNNTEDVMTIAEKIRLTIDQPFDLSGTVVKVSASIGATLGSSLGAKAATRAADDAMYRAKRSGGNRIEWHREPLPVYAAPGPEGRPETAGSARDYPAIPDASPGSASVSASASGAAKPPTHTDEVTIPGWRRRAANQPTVPNIKRARTAIVS